jgi:hypothetical protein
VPFALFARLAAVVAIGFAGATPAMAGAFTLDEGEGKVFATGAVNSGDHYYDRQGRLKVRGAYHKYDLQAYLEYGLRDGLTGFAATGLQRITARDGGRHRREGLGRSEVGLRARLLQRNGWIASAQGSVVIAGAKRSEGVASIGETDDQVDVRGLVARSFEAFGKPAFIDLGAGYRTRSGDPADEIRADATFGIRPAPRLLLLAQSFNTFGTKRWDGPYRLKQRIHKVQAAALYDLTEKLSLLVSVFFTPEARDAMDERGAGVGFGYRF